MYAQIYSGPGFSIFFGQFTGNWTWNLNHFVWGIAAIADFEILILLIFILIMKIFTNLWEAWDVSKTHHGYHPISGLISAESWTHPIPKFPNDGNYPLVKQHKHSKSPLLIGRSTITGPFSIAMLNYQRVIPINESPFLLLRSLITTIKSHEFPWNPYEIPLSHHKVPEIPRGCSMMHLWADGEAKPGHGLVQFARVQKATPAVRNEWSNQYWLFLAMNGWTTQPRSVNEVKKRSFLFFLVLLVRVCWWICSGVTKRKLWTSGQGGLACPSRISERPPSASWFRARRSPGRFGADLTLSKTWWFAM